MYDSFNLSSVLPNGTLLLLTWSCVIHIFGYYPLMAYIRLTFRVAPKISIVLGLLQGALFLLYPVFNYLGESYWSRYRVMFVGTVFSLVGVLVSGPSMAVILRGCLVNLFSDKSCHIKPPLVVVAFLGLVLYCIGVSLFEANALQFGIDQLQHTSRDRLGEFTSLYVWVVYISQFGGLPLIYIMIRLSSAYVSAFFLLIPISLLFVCCREYRRHLITEPHNRHSNPFKYLINYMKLWEREAGNLEPSQESHRDVEDTRTFNHVFSIFLSLIGFFCMQSAYVPKNVSFDFDDDWLIGSRLYYFITTELLQAVPVLSIPVCLALRNTFLAKLSVLKRMRYGLILSLLALFLSLCCSIEFNMAYGYTRSLHPLASVCVLLVSLVKGLSALLILLAVLELIFAFSSHHLQGLLLAFWYSYNSIPFSVRALTSNRTNELTFNLIPLSVETLLALVSLIAFQILSRRISLGKPLTQQLSNGSCSNVV